MRSTFKVLFYLKRDKQKNNGMIPLYCRITVDGKEARFGMKCDINPKTWDVKTGKATGRTTEATKVNALIDNTIAAIHKVYRELQERDNYVTAERVKNVFIGVEIKQQTLLELFDRHNRERKTQVGVTICEMSYNNYVRTRDRLADFIRRQYNVSDIPVKDIDHKFIANFKTYLVVKHEYAHNTLTKYLKCLRHVIGIAIDEEIISKNPFSKHTVQYQTSDRGFLLEDEIDRIAAWKFEESEAKLGQTRDMFLFCSYTGLSYTDLCSLSEENIQQSFDGKLWIKGRRKKSDVEYSIPILDIPKKILEKYATCKFDGKLLPVPKYQTYHNRLKRLGKICGINKNMISHLARHTFGTYTLTKGVSIESVSKMLGHTNIKTTQIYAKITNEKVSNEMNVFAEKIELAREKNDKILCIHALIERWHISTDKWDSNWWTRLDDLWFNLAENKRVSIISQIDEMAHKPDTVVALCETFESLCSDFFRYVYENDKNGCTFYKVDKSYGLYKMIETFKINIMPWDRMILLRLEDLWNRLFDDEKAFILSKIYALEISPQDLQELNMLIRKIDNEFCLMQHEEDLRFQPIKLAVNF